MSDEYDFNDFGDYHGMDGMFPMHGEPDEDITSGEFKATAGEPFDMTTGCAASEEAIIEALHTVYDPEIPVDIYELGLIYEINQGDNGSVDIKMSLTSPGCPVAGEMPGEVARAVADVSGVGEVTVLLVWDPMWTPERMSDDAKMVLDFD